MKFNKILSYAALSVFTVGMLVGCEDESATENQTNKDFVSVADMPKPVDVPEGETVTVEAEVYVGHVSGVDRVISLAPILESNYNDVTETDVVDVTTADSDEYAIPSTVTIPAGSKVGTFQVTLTDIDLGYSGKKVVIGLVPQAGIDIAMSTVGNIATGSYEIINDRLVITARRACLLTSVSLQISTDAWGSETEWELYDGALNLIDSGGPYANLAGGGETRFFCLEDGAYTFVITDTEGDGMGEDGFYRLVKLDDDGNEVVIATGGQFTDDEIVEFEIP
ncbi:hypothetical protein ACLI09_03955 [Flavobacterium sp. RHBU_24]|uniref:hypothetical protein n=1 Tax=Flavobacterium sp. RHBU_24 TaxID=3391185 RepID=UPI003984C62C